MSERVPQILRAQDVIAILKRFAELISDNAQNLCKLDSIVGDGDHGTTIKRGTVAAQEAIDRTTETNIDKLLLTYSMALLSSMGGASGPVFGSLFQGMGLAARDRAELDKAAVVKTFEQALEKVTALGKAEEGDKTLVDALAPAVRAAQAELGQGSDLPVILEASHKAALKGVVNTREMIAKKGRARYSAERSLGHEDAGAVTLSFLFQAFSDYSKK